jgi:hypothetical protein
MAAIINHQCWSEISGALPILKGKLFLLHRMSLDLSNIQAGSSRIFLNILRVVVH